MPFFTEPRVRQSYLEEVQAPLGQSVAAAFDQAAVFNPVASLTRNTELDEAMRGRPIVQFPGMLIGREPVDSPLMTAEAARARVDEEGLELTVPDDGIPERALEILIDRKRQERVRQDTLNRGPTGFVPGALRLGAALGASLLDPINIASAFVPVVGQARYAAMLAGRGAGGRALVRARVVALEGAVGAALVEPIVYSAAVTEQADYDLIDSLTNVAFGSVLGGGLHVAVGGALDVRAAIRARRAPAPALDRLLEAAAPETREALLRTAVAQMAEGRPVDVSALARLDPVLRGETPGATGGMDIDLAALARELPAREAGAPAREPPAAAGESIPSVLTDAQRAALREAGLDDPVIRDLTPWPRPPWRRCRRPR